MYIIFVMSDPQENRSLPIGEIGQFNRKGYFLADRELSEPTSPNYVNVDGATLHYNSNEPGLFLFKDELATAGGVAVGVGLDQMFDLIVNSRVEEAYVVDFLPEVSLTSRALCEEGVHFYDRHDRYPNPEEMLDLLSVAGVARAESNLRAIGYSESETAATSRVLSSVSVTGDRQPIPMAEYLRARLQMDEQGFSWLASAESVQRVLQMYSQGKIHFITADLTGDRSISSIGQRLRDQGKSVGFIYLSNAEDYIELADKKDAFVRNILALPVSGDTKLLRTTAAAPGTYDGDSFQKLPTRSQNLFGAWHYNCELYSHWERNGYPYPKDNDEIGMCLEPLSVLY